jgi:hypothetical protein
VPFDECGSASSSDFARFRNAAIRQSSCLESVRWPETSAAPSAWLGHARLAIMTARRQERYDVAESSDRVHGPRPGSPSRRPSSVRARRLRPGSRLPGSCGQPYGLVASCPSLCWWPLLLDPSGWSVRLTLYASVRRGDEPRAGTDATRVAADFIVQLQGVVTAMAQRGVGQSFVVNHDRCYTSRLALSSIPIRTTDGHMGLAHAHARGIRAKL